MATNYIATAQSSNLVKFSAVGHFLVDKEQHLLTVKSRYLELHAIGREELLDYKQIRVPCSIAGLWSFRPKNFARDLVVLLTRRNELFLLELTLDLKQKVQITTRCTGQYPWSEDLIKLDAGPIAIFHPENRLMCLAIYSQRLEIVEFAENLKSLKAFPIRCPGPDGGKIICMDFIHEQGGSGVDCTVALLQTNHRGHVLSFAHLNTRTRDKEKPIATFGKLNSDADCMLIVPGTKAVASGALIIGNGSVQYYNTAQQYACATSPFLNNVKVTAHCVLYRDPAGNVVTYLLGGADGRLVLLVVRLCAKESTEENPLTAKKPPCRINVEFIGVASAAQTLTVVGHGLVFLGTSAGPASYLIKLRDQSRNPDTKFYYDILQTFPAIGSILELTVVKTTEKQGLDQSCLLACTADTSGSSLTIVRSGINLQDPVEVPLAGIQKSWPISSPGNADKQKKSFILTDFTTTRYCTLDHDDFREEEEAGHLELASRTILFHQVSEHVCLQVTPTAVNLLQRSDLTLLDEWKDAVGDISAACVSKNTLAVVDGRTIHLLQVTPDRILPGRTKDFENEICSLEMFTDQSGDLFLAAGEWITWKVSLVECAPAMSVIQADLSPSDFQPRSLKFCRFSEGVAFFFCGRGDGTVDYYQFDEASKQMLDPKRIPLGTRLVTFTEFHAQGQINVFACSDRPCVISCRNGKLIFSNVSIQDAVDVCPFEPVADGAGVFATDDLMVITASSLSMGHLEDIQKIHHHPVGLGFQVFRLAFQPGASTIAVIGDKKDSRSNKFAVHKAAAGSTDDRLLYILDRHSYEIVTTFPGTDPLECWSCLCHWSPAGKSFLVLGTERGRDGTLVVLELINDRLQVIHTYTVTAEPVRNVRPFGEYLLAATDNALLLFGWLGHQLDAPKRLETGGSTNCHLDLLDNTVLIGDVQKALILADFNPSSTEFQVTATDFSFYGFVSLMLRDKETVMGGDDRGNLLVLTRKQELEGGGGDAASQTLQPLSWISVGDPVTTIKRGSLVSPESIGDVSVTIKDSFVFGTCKGQLGVVFELEEHVFKLLKHVEAHLLATTTVIGTDDLSSASQFCGRLLEGPHQGFIDGDLVETALHLRQSELDQILADFTAAEVGGHENGTKDKLIDHDLVQKILADLVRLH